MWLRTNAEAAACQQAAMETKTAHHGGEKVGPQEELIKPSPIDLGFSLIHVSREDKLYRGAERATEREVAMDGGDDDVEMAGAAEAGASVELDEMKKRLKEMEDEAAALREMQAKVEKEMCAVQDPASATASQSNREEVDSRSVFVGNVDYSCTPEEVQQHFQACGTVNRVTIRTNKFGQPKGYAYVEFLEQEAVQEALLLNESELHGRQLKVSAKRTNIPGMKHFRPRRPNPYMGFRGRTPYPAPFFYTPYGYGKVPRFRAPMRYSPYF
nr:polyadenylate-binding protein 2-like [Ipomoea batatas]GME19741.1 polyadenylate-binding protein 2-like [Ipomoea batatas]